jgi:hypothetical protein
MVSEAASDVWHMLTTFLSGAEETFTLDDAKFYVTRTKKRP